MISDIFGWDPSKQAQGAKNTTKALNDQAKATNKATAATKKNEKATKKAAKTAAKKAKRNNLFFISM